MNKKQFLTIIERIVEKKVKQELSKQLKEIFIKERKNIKEDKKVDLNSLLSEPIIKNETNDEIQEDVHYTKNSTLNKILNETRSGLPNGKESYPTLGGGTFDTSKMSEMMGYGKSEDVQREVAAVDTIKKAGVSVDQVPDHVTNALTKDYSKLMKALDKKKGN
tara:strand:- start:4906 stop:5394 length:489 start_codon:yes stop_codon:yes gene_type:complete